MANYRPTQIYHFKPSVFVDAPGPSLLEVTPLDRMWRCIADATDLCRAILSTPEARTALADIALRYNNQTSQFLTLMDSLSNAKDAAKEFIHDVIHRFPIIVVDETFYNPDCLATSQRFPMPYPIDPARYTIRLNAPRVHAMVSSVNFTQRSYVFQLALTLVHEIGGHLFMTSLTGGQANTPRKIRHPSFTGHSLGDSHGESGRYLELLLFGGAIFFAADKNVHGSYQCGIPYVIDLFGDARRIHPRAINDFVVRRAFQFPLPVEEAPIPHKDLVSLTGRGIKLN